MELSTVTILVVSLISLVILADLLSRRKSTPNPKKRRPPGPWGLRFVGCLHHLLTSQPQVALRDLAKKHGPVMYLRLGEVNAVVVSSPAAAQEVLRDNDISFASRPSLLATEIICYGNLDVAFAPYGAYWRALRKLCMLELLSARKVRKFAPVRDSETLSLVGEVRAAARGGEPVNIMLDYDLFTAGAETTSSTAEWVMSELMRNPEAMAKTQAEVRQVLDGKRPHDHERHIDTLPYMKMVIKESMRLHPAVPLLLPRVCRETCDVGGFEIAEGTRVMVNAWAMARSPEHWDDAEEFRPERFEDSTADYKGTRFEYLPFGSGRRMCPGNGFALAVLELVVARLLYYFDWSLPAGMRPDELDMDVTVGSTARRSSQLHLVASPYKVPMYI